MAHSQKCPHCHTWNDDRDYCSQCHYVLNYEVQRKLEVGKKEEEHQQKKDKVDLFLDRMKTSRYAVVRGLYFLFYWVWLIYAAIVSFFIALIAAGPG